MLLITQLASYVKTHSQRSLNTSSHCCDTFKAKSLVELFHWAVRYCRVEVVSGQRVMSMVWWKTTYLVQLLMVLSCRWCDGWWRVQFSCWWCWVVDGVMDDDVFSSVADGAELSMAWCGVMDDDVFSSVADGAQWSMVWWMTTCLVQLLMVLSCRWCDGWWRVQFSCWWCAVVDGVMDDDVFSSVADGVQLSMVWWMMTCSVQLLMVLSCRWCDGWWRVQFSCWWCAVVDGVMDDDVFSSVADGAQLSMVWWMMTCSVQLLMVCSCRWCDGWWRVQFSCWWCTVVNGVMDDDCSVQLLMVPSCRSVVFTLPHATPQLTRPDMSSTFWMERHSTLRILCSPEIYSSLLALVSNVFHFTIVWINITNRRVGLLKALKVLWRCWLGGRKGIRPVKTEWLGAGCLERGADLHMAQLMPLPLTVSCFSIMQIGFTSPPW